MQTFTVRILNEKAVNLLKDMEELKLIELEKKNADKSKTFWALNYKGKLSKQPVSEVDKQLQELRDSWE